MLVFAINETTGKAFIQTQNDYIVVRVKLNGFVEDIEDLTRAVRCDNFMEVVVWACYDHELTRVSMDFKDLASFSLYMRKKLNKR